MFVKYQWTNEIPLRSNQNELEYDCVTVLCESKIITPCLSFISSFNILDAKVSRILYSAAKICVKGNSLWTAEGQFQWTKDEGCMWGRPCDSGWQQDSRRPQLAGVSVSSDGGKACNARRDTHLATFYRRRLLHLPATDELRARKMAEVGLDVFYQTIRMW